MAEKIRSVVTAVAFVALLVLLWFLLLAGN